jgi:membrane-associated phospholipid phosphatase
MDAIEALDDGANALFTFQMRAYPAIKDYMQIAYYISSYVGMAVIGLLIVLVLFVQRRHRAALAAVVGFASAFAVIAFFQHFVPRARPQLAVEWLGDTARTGSYPSSGVFLFMLGAILLGAALWAQLRSFWQRAVYVGLAAGLTVWVCLSQFLLATNYVSDVIGALAGATLIGWLTCRVMQADLPRRENQP